MILVLLLLTSAWMFFYLKNSETFWIVAWPGTVMHETLHWTVGKVMGGNPTKISVLPEKDSRIIGYVNFANITWFNCVPISMAPMLGVPVAWLLFHYLQPIDFTWIGAVKFWVISATLASSWPSSVDFKLSARHPEGWLFWGGLAVLFLGNKYYHFFG